jgi:hypothetical protein
MPYTNVNVFREKRGKTFSKKVWEPLNFMKKWVKKIIADFLLLFNSKLRAALTRTSILTSI